jgi:hypothetical protein
MHDVHLESTKMQYAQFVRPDQLACSRAEVSPHVALLIGPAWIALLTVFYYLQIQKKDSAGRSARVQVR